MKYNKERVSKQNKLNRERRLAKPLTDKEKKIIRMICDEKKSKSIAKELGQSIRTIENDRNIILVKLNCESSIGVAIYAVKHGIYKIE